MPASAAKKTATKSVAKKAATKKVVSVAAKKTSAPAAADALKAAPVEKEKPAATVPAEVKPAAKEKKKKAAEKQAGKQLDKPASGKTAATGAPKEKLKKPKMVRDSFTMPEPEYKVLGEVKRACLKAGVAVKKSELLRVGVALLQKMKVEEVQACLGALAPVKAGRPKAAK